MKNKFFDVKNHKPKKGQVIANYRAKAELVAGEDKIRLIDLLMSQDRLNAALQMMRNIFLSLEEDAYNVCRSIMEDALSGLTVEEINEKPYKYTLNKFFYANPEDVPEDIHWTVYHCIGNDKIDSIVQK